MSSSQFFYSADSLLIGTLKILLFGICLILLDRSFVTKSSYEAVVKSTIYQVIKSLICRFLMAEVLMTHQSDWYSSRMFHNLQYQ